MLTGNTNTDVAYITRAANGYINEGNGMEVENHNTPLWDQALALVPGHKDSVRVV